MKNISIKKLLKKDVIEKAIIMIASIILTFLLVCLFFNSHFLFHTVINGVNVSLKAYEDTDYVMRSYAQGYKLQLIERNGLIEEISGQDIGMKYKEENSISDIYHIQNSFQWIGSLFKNQNYHVKDVYVFNKNDLETKINELNCMNKDITEPQNVSFIYFDGSYELIEEVQGNKINKDRLYEAIKNSILEGKTKLDLNEKLCYEKPKYTLSSKKTLETKNLLDKYVSTDITYRFGNENEILDGNIINEWLSVDENLDVVINKSAVMKYIEELSQKYDTVRRIRNFKTSTGKLVEVKGGLYGWKINQTAEAKDLLESIMLGEVIEKEPKYIQKALSRAKDDIGNTYVEINISKQHLWFYKNGELIVDGSVVTGNPNKGNSTVVGTYMLMYKIKNATLSGVGYEVKVTYWMPFYGNMGIHDAHWRYSFGGEIYKKNGTHGCVNAPLYLAKAIYENIEEGVPVICYKE